MIVGLACPRELDAEEVGYLPHEVDVGERGKLFFKGDFTVTGGAEVHEVIHVETEVDGGAIVATDEDTGVVGSGMETAGL